jgi:hypothetical protein
VNPEIQKELLAWLTGVRELAAQGKDFVLEQAPLVVREAIAYGRAVETWYVVISLIGLVVFYYIAQKLYRHDNTEMMPFPLIGCCVSLAALCINVPDMLMAWFAPRIYVVNWLMDMISRAHGTH